MSSTLPHLLTHDKNMNSSECEECMKYEVQRLICNSCKCRFFYIKDVASYQ